jgi:hypothetical protein
MFQFRSYQGIQADFPRREPICLHLSHKEAFCLQSRPSVRDPRVLSTFPAFELAWFVCIECQGRNFGKPQPHAAARETIGTYSRLGVIQALGVPFEAWVSTPLRVSEPCETDVGRRGRSTGRAAERRGSTRDCHGQSMTESIERGQLYSVAPFSPAMFEVQDLVLGSPPSPGGSGRPSRGERPARAPSPNWASPTRNCRIN